MKSKSLPKTTGNILAVALLAIFASVMTPSSSIAFCEACTQISVPDPDGGDPFPQLICWWVTNGFWHCHTENSGHTCYFHTRCYNAVDLFPEVIEGLFVERSLIANVNTCSEERTVLHPQAQDVAVNITM